MSSISAPTPQAKPPNVLVLASSQAEGRDKDSVFSLIKEGLTAGLDVEMYAVYLLCPEDAVRTPWKDNCCLLVVPSLLQSEALGAGLLSELESYVQGGGAVLSMHPTTNAALGFRFPERFLQSKLVGVVQITANEMAWPESYIVVQTCIVGKNLVSLPNVFSTLHQKSAVDVLARMKQVNIDAMERAKSEGQEVDNTSAVADCIQHVRFVECSGQAVLSHVDMLASTGSREAGISELVTLKRDAGKVVELLQTVLQRIGMECPKGESSSPTLSYLMCSDQLRVKFESAMAPLVKDDIIRGSEVDIELVNTETTSEGSSVDPLPCPAVNKVVLLTKPSQIQLHGVGFDISQYMRCLRTGHLGRTLLYTLVIGSTQTMLTGNLPFSLALKTDMGVVCAAGQQTQGRGRHGNVWLSPKGCMMFSTIMTVKPQSRLHGKLPLLQHIVALSVVSAIRTIPGYEELPVCLKWPNDIYYQNQVKLGGILVTSFSGGSSSAPTLTIIGCGVNVCNRYPTMSINDCIQLHNTERGTSLPPFTVEVLLALTLNRLERYLSLYEDAGMASVERDYYQYWLHSNTVVQLGSRGNEEVTVTGISEYGYLQVCTRNGEKLTLQPDGNSFDIMKNLIVMK